ncbi:MAG TPA: SpoIIE family protein phosphatase [Actinomycetota bacterium]|nr:SpoIIE family protein phosphatase [Actinomycetota bacterium]
MSDDGPGGGGAGSPRPRVLLVDDRTDNLLALQAVLEPLDLAMVSVTSGEEALKALLSQEFSLIVLDVQMPGLDGFETARLIKQRERTRHIPIVFLTAISGAEEHHLAGYASGAIDYVYKPFEPAILRAKVAALVELVQVRERLETEVAERRASERRLAEQGRQLAQAESLAQVGAWRWDLGSGEVGWSDELYRIFGLAPGVEVATGSYLAQVHPEDRQRVAAALERTRHSGQPYLLEHRAVRADGSLAWIRAQGRLDAGSQTLFGAAQDVTERRRVEEEFTQFFNLSLDLMAVATFDGALRQVNPSFTRLLGWEASQLLGRSYLDLIHEHDRTEAARELLALREGREIADRELRMLAAGGGERWFRVSGRPVPEDGVIYLVGIDITERKRAALLLAESEARYRVLVDHAPEAIVVFDLDTGRFVDANPQAERLFGLGRSQLLALTPSDVSSPEGAGGPGSAGSGLKGSAPGVPAQEAWVVPEAAATDGAERAAGATGATGAWVRRVLDGDTEPFEWVLQPAAAEPTAAAEAAGAAAGGEAAAAEAGRPAPVLCEVRLHELPASERRLARGTIVDITERRRVETEAGALAERERAMRQSKEIAEALQRALLPEQLAEIPGLDLAARYLPGSAGLEVGGDWYDVIPAASGAVCLAIGDVVGRGLRAAATMGQLRTALRAYALQESSPGQVIERLESLVKWLPEASMTTLVFAVYEPDAGILTYSCAGHPPPLVIDADGHAFYLQEGRGTPLGVQQGGIAEGAAVLEPGSVLIFYTDGLIERPGAGLDDGMDLLAEVARQAAPRGPDAVCEAVTEALIGDSPSNDDVALLVVSFAPMHSHRFHLSLAADPQRLRTLRQSLTRWLTYAGATAGECQDIVLAVSEAATNSIIHAYAGEDGVIEVEAVLDPARAEVVDEGQAASEFDARYDGGAARGAPTVTVTIQDRGDWRFLQTPGGGRGLSLMQALVDECTVVAGPRGTEVRLRRGLGRPLAAAFGKPMMELPEALEEIDPGDAESIAIARLVDELDASNVIEVGAALANSVRKDQWGLVMDMADLRYIDSSAMRLLVEVKRRLDRRRQSLWAVVPAESPVRRVLDLTGITGVLPVAQTVAEAVNAIRREREAIADRYGSWPDAEAPASGPEPEPSRSKVRQ